MKTWLWVFVSLVTGALLGGFLGRALILAFPHNRLHPLLVREIVAGLHTTRLDLGVMDVTFGCMFHFNMMSVLGVVLAAVAARIFFR